MRGDEPVSKWWWIILRVAAGLGSVVAAWDLVGWGVSFWVLAAVGCWLASGWRKGAASLAGVLGWGALMGLGRWEACWWVGWWMAWWRVGGRDWREGHRWERWEWVGWLVVACVVRLLGGGGGGVADVWGGLVVVLGLVDPRWVRPWLGVGEVVRMGFDAECLFCSRMIRFLAHEDGSARLRFLPLQSTRGREMAMRAGSENLTTVVVEVRGEGLTRSAAMVATLRLLGGHWRVVGEVLRLVPRGILDVGYDWIARHRYSLSGRARVCELPDEALKWRLESGEEGV